ncbi:hypothetical protein JXB02_03855 [Candidatus Woesearchaeota archaeon]|nr:hypothetical protein [Candidatus Woesearchaeota archaeon]
MPLSHHTKRRAQVQGQVIVYVLSLVVVSLILLYGYNAIRSFRDRAEDVETVQFRTEIQAAVKSLSADTGTFRKMEFFVPETIDEVCFADIVKKGFIYVNGVDSETHQPVGPPVLRTRVMGWTFEQSGSYPYICDSICGSCPALIMNMYYSCADPESGSGHNIFLRTKGRLIDSFSIGTITVYQPDTTNNFEDFRCFPINQGKLRIKLTGEGKSTNVAGWDD